MGEALAVLAGAAVHEPGLVCADAASGAPARSAAAAIVAILGAIVVTMVFP
jgi:hypothetical protein